MTLFPDNAPGTDLPALASEPAMLAGSGSPAENCARIRELGFRTSQHIKMYGQRLELTSDPFNEGDYTAIHALSGSDPTVRTIRLPVAILTGLSGNFRYH